MEKISVVVPTYNEADNIKKLVTGIKKAYPDSEIIVVDDNSPDKTWKVAKGMDNVRVIRRMTERGLGSAVIEGFKHAKTRIIGVMDADLSHPPEKIPELVSALAHADISIASRLVKGGGVENWPLHRRMISMVATLMARHLTDVKDPMSGFFFFNRKIIKGINLETKGYKILLEILVKAKYKKAAEVAYVFRNRDQGESKLGPGEYLRYLKQIGHLTFRK